MKKDFLQLFLALCLFYSCSFNPFWWQNKNIQEKLKKFTFFNPYLKSNVAQNGYKQQWCFTAEQGIRPSLPWHFCFEDKDFAQQCYQKIYRLQKNNRQKRAAKELYRPGEIVDIGYELDRAEYRARIIKPQKCLAYKIGDTHLIRSKEGNSTWRLGI